MQNIRTGALSDCTSLTSITIPDSVTSIESYAFENCTSLTDITIPDSVTSIEEYSFNNCTGLTGITIPESVTNIGESAFSGCISLKSIAIPGNVTDIKSYTFKDCSSLPSIIIPENVTDIGELSFFNCSDLTDITIENPDCEIYDSGNTICNGLDEQGEIYFNGTIYGYENSTAQAYAEKYGYKFEIISPAAEEIKPGDADGDGKVNILDVISVNKAVLGKESLTDAQLKAIDFNQNGKPDSEESLTIMKFIVGLIPSLTA